MTANTWSAAGTIPAYPLAGIAGGICGTIANGSVIAGMGWGSSGTPTGNSYRYDPGLNTWSQIANTGGGAILDSGYGVLSNGSVLTFAGINSSFNYISTSYRYDPGANAWTQVANYPTALAYIGSAALSNGSILGVGGQTSTPTPNNQVNRYDPGANTWTPVANYAYIAIGLACAKIGNGCILAITGANAGHAVTAGVYSNCYLYDPVANSWARTASYPIAVYSVAAASLTNGSVLAFGGSANYTTVSTANAYRYDPGANAWTQVANYPVSGNTTESGAVLLSNGSIMGIGGENDDNNNQPQPNCYSYDPGYITVSSGSSGIMIGL